MDLTTQRIVGMLFSDLREIVDSHTGNLNDHIRNYKNSPTYQKDAEDMRLATFRLLDRLTTYLTLFPDFPKKDRYTKEIELTRKFVEEFYTV